MYVLFQAVEELDSFVQTLSSAASARDIEKCLAAVRQYVQAIRMAVKQHVREEEAKSATNGNKMKACCCNSHLFSCNFCSTIQQPVNTKFDAFTGGRKLSLPNKKQAVVNSR